MRTPLPAVTTAITLALAGCSFEWIPAIGPPDADDRPTAVRHIEIEVADLESGLPCEVIDRPDADSRNLLWRAEYEEGFCRRKAEETRLVLENKGWICRRLEVDERRDLVQATAPQSDKRSHLVAAWRCVEGPQSIAERPPVPSAKPEPSAHRSDLWGDDRLRATVEKDLAAIGRNVIDDETGVDTALGDLNDDGEDDAIVVLTPDADRGPSHRMLMAYLRTGDAYSLVDVWILDAPADRAAGRLAVAIEDGRVRLETCCEAGQGRTVLELADRKLAYVRES